MQISNSTSTADQHICFHYINVLINLCNKIPLLLHSKISSLHYCTALFASPLVRTPGTTCHMFCSSLFFRQCLRACIAHTDINTVHITHEYHFSGFTKSLAHIINQLSMVLTWISKSYKTRLATSTLFNNLPQKQHFRHLQ